MKKCILSRLENVKTIQSSGASESFLVSGKLESINVVVKFALKSDEDDNSLEIERKMYMYVKEELSKWTPNLLPGIESSHCSIEIFKNSKINEKIKQQWAILVNPEIDTIEEKMKRERKQQKENIKPKLHKNSFHGDIDDDESESESEISESESEEESGSELDEERTWEEAMALIENSPKEYSKLTKIYYIVTPKMNGIELYDFLESKENKLDESMLVEIAIQVAQVLSVFDKFKIKHNDLHPKNIFIEILDKPKLIEYHYPIDFTLHTRFKITVFDYDKLSFVKKLGRNTTLASELCVAQGICDKYIANFDWYTFLTYLIGIVESNNVLVPNLRRIYGSNAKIQVKNFEVEKMKDSALGYACVCTEVTNGRNAVCTQCHEDIQRLSMMISPNEFIIEENKMKKSSTTIHY